MYTVYTVCTQVLPRGSLANYLLTPPLFPQVRGRRGGNDGDGKMGTTLLGFGISVTVFWFGINISTDIQLVLSFLLLLVSD